jgi:hypothetical protein
MSKSGPIQFLATELYGPSKDQKLATYSVEMVGKMKYKWAMF